MGKKTYLHRGLVTKVEEKFAAVAKLFDLERFVRDTLRKLKVAAADDCCPEFEPYFEPVRYNSDEQYLERYDKDAKEWTPDGVIGLTQDVTIEATDGTHTLNFVNGLLTSASFTPTP